MPEPGPSGALLSLHAGDNVAVATRAIAAGEAAGAHGLVANVPIPRGHKIATRHLAAGEAVIKYGQFIGQASASIAPGDHVHTHNCAFAPAGQDYQFATGLRWPAVAPGDGARTFMGYRRPGGRVGTRNYLAVISSVNCSASAAARIARAYERPGALDDFPNIDGVVAFTHGTGCGMAANGEGFEMLERVLWGMVTHGNIGGVLLVGLGCEVLQIGAMMRRHAITDSERFSHLTIQASGGTSRAIDLGVEKVGAMLGAVNDVERQPVPVSELIVALQCGGSDAYSGITANPALGAASDILVGQGGTTILSETPEIYGAEHLLTRRAISREVGEKLVERIEWWQDYTRRHGGSMDNNPSPGNKAGGLTTILEKSLGAVAKSGTAPLNGVYGYAEKPDSKGFVFMDSPGYDPVSVTGQIAAGAHLVCFTTGRGSAFGSRPAPAIKLASNTAIYKAMDADMDINCGDILEGKADIGQKGTEIFEAVLRVASGERTKSEQLGLGDLEFVPWQIGAVM